MSNILEDTQLELNINANINNEALSSLDPTNEYIDNLTFNQDPPHSHSSSVSNSNTSNTTPEFNSPDDQHFLNYNYKYDHIPDNVNYNYQDPGQGQGQGHSPGLNQSPVFHPQTPSSAGTTGVSGARPVHTKSASFSLPDKLNLLSLQNMSATSSKSPSPEFMYYSKGLHDDRTINPKQLISSKGKGSKPVANQPIVAKSKTKKVPKKDLDSTMPGMGISTDYKPDGSKESLPKDYILPSSSSSPNLSSIFNQYHRTHKDMDFKMNNECVDAIRTWLNNDVNDKNNNEMLVNPTGILKNYNGYEYDPMNMNAKRRNSIQAINPSSYDLHPQEKRKRRKSSTARLHTLNEFKNSLVNLNFHDQENHEQSDGEMDEIGINVNEINGINGMDEMDTITSMSGLDMEVGIEEMNNETLEMNSSMNEANRFSQLNQKRTGRVGPKPKPQAEIKEEKSISIETNDKNGPKEEEGKPFPCPDCTKQFKRSEHLKRHIRSVHSNIRPFHCKYCEKQFSRSDNLAQHLKTHYKLNENGTTLIIYGNPNLHNRGGRRKNSTNAEKEASPQDMETFDMTV